MWVWSVFGPLKCGGDSVYLPAELPLGAAALGLTASQRLPGSLQLLLQEHHLLLWGHLHSESLGAADNLPLDTRRNVIIVTHWDNVSAFPTAFLSLAILNFHLEIFSYKYQLLAILIGKDWCQVNLKHFAVVVLLLRMNLSCERWWLCGWPAESEAAVGEVSPGRPAASSCSEPSAYRAQQPAACSPAATHGLLLSNKTRRTNWLSKWTQGGLIVSPNSCSVCLAVPLLVWGWVRRCLWCSRTSSWVL